MDYESVGQMIADHELDQKVVAERLELSEQTMSRWVKHDDEIPIGSLGRLQEVLGVSREELIDAMSDQLIFKALREGWFPRVPAVAVSSLKEVLKVSGEDQARIAERVRSAIARYQKQRGTS